MGSGLSVQPANHPDGSTPIYFAADIVDGANDNTGVWVGATLTGGGVPEPASWAMMIMGVFTIGATMRQRRTRAMIAA